MEVSPKIERSVTIMYAVYNSELREVYGVFKTFEEAEAFRDSMSFEDAIEDMNTRLVPEDEMWADLNDEEVL